MTQSPVLLDTPEKRLTVTEAIERTCTFRDWRLLAVNVRTNHVHVVLIAEAPVEKVLADIKAWATRALRERGLVSANEKVWALHGSTRYLTTDAAVELAVNYTLFEQGPGLE